MAKISFQGMRQNFYQGDNGGAQFVTFLDMEQEGGLIKLASSEVDLSAIPYLVPVRIEAEIKSTPSKSGSMNNWVVSAVVTKLNGSNPKEKGGD